MPNEPAAIAVDVGGTTIKGVAVLGDGTSVRRVVAPTFRVRGEAFSTMVEVIRELGRGLGESGRSISAIGVSSPGLVDPSTGTIELASNLAWRGMDLGGELRDRFAVPVTVDNDARTGAFAEMAAVESVPDQIFVPVGTGVSAAISVSGEVLRGATNSAGEFGHLRIVPNGDECTCGSRGCIEAYVSAWGIVARYRRTGIADVDSAKDVLARATEDPSASRVWAEAVDGLAVGLASLVSLVDPGRIVVGGGLSLAGDALMVPLRAAVSGYLPWREAPTIVASRLGSSSALVGAALNAWSPPSSDASGFVERLRDGIAGAVPVVDTW